MRLSILGKRWWLRFVALRTNRGECDPPTKPNKEIRVDCKLQGEGRLEVIIHEPTAWSHGYGLQFVNKGGEFTHLNVPIDAGKSFIGPLLKMVKV